MEKFTIRPARREDAPAIGRGVVMALGAELPLDLAGGDPARLPLVDRLFTELAASDNAQYSWNNTLVAEAEDGTTAGILVSYDGARLHELRRTFIAAARDILEWHINEAELADETEPGEVYLDSLAVFPEYRGHGLGALLIEAAARHHASVAKPLGLLCDPGNPRAHALYERLGFRDIGRRPFSTHLMHHMHRR